MRAIAINGLTACMLFAIIGCGKTKEAKSPIELSAVPADVMKVAKDRLPDVTFERAMRKANGEYEVIGKSKNGKVREIDIKPDGTVTEID